MFVRLIVRSFVCFCCLWVLFSYTRPITRHTIQLLQSSLGVGASEEDIEGLNQLSFGQHPDITMRRCCFAITFRFPLSLSDVETHFGVNSGPAERQGADRKADVPLYDSRAAENATPAIKNGLHRKVGVAFLK